MNQELINIVKEPKILTKISIFDFDGTLVNTPSPDEGKKRWEEVVGSEWPHKGWWGREESLDIDVFEHPLNEKVLNAYHEELKNGNSLKIMLTGRRPKLEKAVKSILDNNGLKFDAYLFNDGGDTLSNKIKQIKFILDNIPTIYEIEMWEDREEHYHKFLEWGNNLVNEKRLETFKINLII